MQHLPAAERRRFEAALHATREPLAWLRIGPEDERLTALSLSALPEGEELLLARVGYHGDPVEWLVS